jgi:hypothetical protein
MRRTKESPPLALVAGIICHCWTCRRAKGRPKSSQWWSRVLRLPPFRSPPAASPAECRPSSRYRRCQRDCRCHAGSDHRSADGERQSAASSAASRGRSRAYAGRAPATRRARRLRTARPTGAARSPTSRRCAVGREWRHRSGRSRRNEFAVGGGAGRLGPVAPAYHAVDDEVRHVDVLW